MMERLREIIRELPPGMEFLIVVSWAFGLPIFSSILIVSGSDYSGKLVVYNNEALLSILIFEVLQSALRAAGLHDDTRLQLEVAPTIVVRTDAVRLRQIVINLLTLVMLSPEMNLA